MEEPESSRSSARIEIGKLIQDSSDLKNNRADIQIGVNNEYHTASHSGILGNRKYWTLLAERHRTPELFSGGG